ncbi:MAG: hypothetical protein ACOH1J_00205 [Microbacteriaceae bacterium]
MKIWLACAEHEDYLEHYLSSRNFPVVVGSLDVSIAAEDLGN